MSPDVAQTFGALLIGGFFASYLSGGVSVQTLLYFKLYPTDRSVIEALVVAIWILDSCHTGLIWGSLWIYFVEFYGMKDQIDLIPTTLALSITFTGILTFLVQSYFAHRILMLSKRNWLLVAPMFALATLRLVSATTTSGMMLHYRSFLEFRQHVSWLFTLGLALSSSVDIIITSSLFVLLRQSKAESTSLDSVIDSLILYAFETGSITCAATIISMILWITIPTRLIFMAMHFFIGKFYATSILVSLNTRRRLQEVHAKSIASSTGVRRHTPSLLPSRLRQSTVIGIGSGSQSQFDFFKNHSVTELQINVQRSVEFTTDPN